MLDTKALAEATALIVREHLDKAVDAATKPLILRIAELEAHRAEPGQPGADGRDGVDGRGVEPAEVERMIKEAVAKAIAGLPAPVAGKDGADGRDGKDGVDGQPGAKGADGSDGAGIGDLLIDRGGELVATFTDGRTKALGVVVGNDGAPGAAGADAFGFDDLAIEHDGERHFVIRFLQGERSKEFAFDIPVVIDRGVWREGEYKSGDAVTWAGSLWIAQKDTEAKPDSGDGWRLSVKRGRDGKAAEPIKVAA